MASVDKEFRERYATLVKKEEDFDGRATEIPESVSGPEEN